MSRTLQFRRYANTDLTSITGADGELIIDETNHYLTIHDGVTPGGVRALGSGIFRLTANSTSFTLLANGHVYMPFTNNSNLKFFDGTFQNTAYPGSTIFTTAIQAAAQTEPQNAQSVSYVIANTDAGKHLYYTNSANVNLYIPWTANTTFANGTFIKIISHSTSNVIVTPNNGVSLYAPGITTSNNHNVTTYGVATLQMVAANTWYIYGSGVN